MSTLVSSCSILSIATVLGNVWVGFIFLIIFISVRMFAGGYHAKTYFGCFVTSNLVFIFSFIVVMILCGTTTFHAQYLMLLVSGSIITLLGPIKNLHHPLSVKASAKNKAIARIIVVAEIFCSLVYSLLTDDRVLLSAVAVSLSAVTVMMIVPVILLRKGGAV